jgi:2-methylcitrate dehydratase PrpD
MGSLGSIWELERGIALKRFPACWSSHRAVTGLLQLLDERPGGLDGVAAIEVDLRETPLLRTAPDTGLAGKFSMAFNLAVTAVKGALPEIDDYGLARLEQAEVREAMTLVEHHKDASDEVVRIALRDRDGTVRTKEVRRALGDPHDGLDPEFVAAKFRLCAGRRLPEAKAAELGERLLALESCADVDELVALGRVSGEVAALR